MGAVILASPSTHRPVFSSNDKSLCHCAVLSQNTTFLIFHCSFPLKNDVLLLLRNTGCLHCLSKTNHLIFHAWFLSHLILFQHVYNIYSLLSLMVKHYTDEIPHCIHHLRRGCCPGSQTESWHVAEPPVEQGSKPRPFNWHLCYPIHPQLPAAVCRDFSLAIFKASYLFWFFLG